MSVQTESPFTVPLRTMPQRNPAHLEEVANGRIAHTLTACTRCRQRKSRCDPGIPRCEPCQRSNAKCVYYDPARNRTISRTYILQLRERIKMLSQELAQVESEISHSTDAEFMVRGAGLIKFKETDEPRFLGPSSGITITRLVMEIAKQNTNSKSIKEVVNEATAQEIKYAFTLESQKPTSKIYPMISSVAEPNLPPRELAYRLVDIFMAKAQYMLPTLHEPSFRREIDAVLDGSQDPCHNFQARLVIAISMQKLSPQYAGLADSYYLAGLSFLDASIKRMDLSTLQCLALIAQYSILTPTRTAAYWVVGVAVKLCQDLGLTDEATITKSPSGPLDCLELDMRRRLFWIITSMEYGLSHSLGRPSAFAVTHDHINMEFFSMVDDRFITRGGILPGSQPIMKKCIAIHFFKMRLLQAEIRRTLYLKKRDRPLDDKDPWFTTMLAKLDRWVTSCPKNDEGSGLSELWFTGRRNTMIVFMFRPSPQIPEPSLEAARRCYDASTFNIKMHKTQVATGSVDLTWVFTQSVFMALNTILWSLSYPSIRQEHTIDEVKSHIAVALDIIIVSAERWPGVESALQLYRNLIAGCLRAYGTDESYVVKSPSNRPSPSSSQEATTPPALSSPCSDATVSVTSSRHTTIGERVTPDPSPSLSRANPNLVNPPQPYPICVGRNPSPGSSEATTSPAPFIPQTKYQQPTQPMEPVVTTSYAPPAANSGDPAFDPNSLYNHFPSVLPGLQHWDPNYTAASTTAGYLSYSNANVDPLFWLGSIGDQYSQFFNQQYPTDVRGRSLTQEEHMELMANLVQNPPDASCRSNEPMAYYSCDMP
ncbi:fungal specific transcription factor domain-containing protein [Histoplasma capsulatum G186AR]|nr:fungal specific transcription factor domain-containing protein [Histoplasma capsulatum]QSS75894.1 fungal specific transcription factor domain-containing protein [Histoplasma capsulatum G186AR]